MKDKVATYYQDTRKYYSDYHDHKETSAWAGVVLYVLLCGVVTNLEGPQPGGELWFDAGFTLFLVVIGGLVFLYVRHQLVLKDLAAAHAAAATYLLAEILIAKDSDFEPSEFMAIEDSACTIHQSSHVLPQKLLDKSEVLRTRGSSAAFATKTLAYALIIVISVGVLVSRWVA